jgi:transcriptional regulator with XRE-family HTH domain
MKKSITSRDYRKFLKLLVECREQAGLTQIQLGEAIGETQSTVSKMERGERRIDVIELFAICAAIGISPSRFVDELSEALSKGAK